METWKKCLPISLTYPTIQSFMGDSLCYLGQHNLNINMEGKIENNLFMGSNPINNQPRPIWEGKTANVSKGWGGSWQWRVEFMSLEISVCEGKGWATWTCHLAEKNPYIDSYKWLSQNFCLKRLRNNWQRMPRSLYNLPKSCGTWVLTSCLEKSYGWRLNIRRYTLLTNTLLALNSAWGFHSLPWLECIQQFLC